VHDCADAGRADVLDIRYGPALAERPPRGNRTTPLTLHRQFLRFAGVGALAAVAHYGTLIALVESGALDPVTATLCGFIAGAAISYGLNRRVTFRSDRPHRAALPRFLVIAGVGFVLTGALMALLNGRAGLPYLVAQVATTGLVLLWTFSANRWWTFRVPAGQRS
jgi:putative flippase GtrA